MATVTEVNNYLSSIRVSIADYVESVCLKEQLGHTDTFCDRQKVILLTAYLDCIVDYFTPFITAGVDDLSYDTNNFFTTSEIKDIIQHINNLADSFYTLDL